MRLRRKHEAKIQKQKKGNKMKKSELENILSGALNKLHKQDIRKLKEKKKKDKQRELSSK